MKKDKNKGFNKREYNKNYYANNRAYYKEWFGKFEGSFLYIVLRGQEVLYVGMTTNIYTRISNHLNCNVSSTKEVFESDNWTSIKYIDLTSVVDSEMELKMLENTLIELYEPKCNTVKNIIKGMDKLRELQLLSYLHSAIEEWKTYKSNEIMEINT